MAIPENPITRKETFLAKAAGQDVSLPENTLTREEAYLRAIAEGGGGGGTGDMTKAIYDTNDDGVVDEASIVNGHTVEADVPSDAAFTDTVYDDTILKTQISNLSAKLSVRKTNDTLLIVTPANAVAETYSPSKMIYGDCVWSDGSKIYMSRDNSQYELIVNDSTVNVQDKTWNGLTNFSGTGIWTDGDNIYLSSNTKQYVLDKSTSTWSPKTWSEVSSFFGIEVWTDGKDIYLSTSFKLYVLNKSTSTWENIGNTPANGKEIWSDGDNIYAGMYYKFNPLDKKFEQYTFVNPPTNEGNGVGDKVWTDGKDIYFSRLNSSFPKYNQHLKLNKLKNAWEPMDWGGVYFSGSDVWFDGTNYHACSGPNKYRLTLPTYVSVKPRT